MFWANLGCKSKSGSQSLSQSDEDMAAIQKGKAVYQSGCIACHNLNPRLDGALGPAVAGSSLELLEARLLRAEYPAGYTPKRSTKQMVALPQFKNDLPALFKYLQSIQP